MTIKNTGPSAPSPLSGLLNAMKTAPLVQKDQAPAIEIEGDKFIKSQGQLPAADPAPAPGERLPDMANNTGTKQTQGGQRPRPNPPPPPPPPPRSAHATNELILNYANNTGTSQTQGGTRPGRPPRAIEDLQGEDGGMGLPALYVNNTGTAGTQGGPRGGRPGSRADNKALDGANFARTDVPAWMEQPFEESQHG